MLAGLINLITTAGVCSSDTTRISDDPDLISGGNQGWGQVGFDTAAFHKGSQPAPLSINGREYAKGLGSFVPCDIKLDLRGKYSLFEAKIGVQSMGPGTHGIAFQVFGDGRKLFESGPFTPSSDAAPVSVPIKGVDELVLATTFDGADPYRDQANWADARLTVDPDFRPIDYSEGVDLAQFGQVVSWDPAQTEGTKAGRVEEIQADDLFPETELLPNAAGHYGVPVSADGVGCIGVQWLEPRQVRTLALEFADASAVPSADGVTVQYWATAVERGASSSSRWQGLWEPLKGDVRREGNSLVIDADWKRNPNRRFGTTKVRWLLPGLDASAKAGKLSVYSDSPWAIIDVQLQVENAAPGARAEVNSYNCEIITDSGSATHADWDIAKPLKLKLRYAVPKPWAFDRSSIRIGFDSQSPKTGILSPSKDILSLSKDGFGVAIDDMLKHGPIYVADFGFFATVDPAATTLAEHKAKIAGERTVLERVREMPDQTFEQAMEHVHRPDGDLGPTLISLACENHKFIHHRDGTIAFDLPDYPWQTMDRMQLFWKLTRSFGTGVDQKITRKPEGGWLPIAVTDVEDAGVQYRQRTYVAPFGAALSGDDRLEWLNSKPLCVCEYTITNPSDKPAEVSVALGVAAVEHKNVTPPNPPALELSGDLAVFSTEGKPFVWLSTAGASELNIKASDGVVTISGTLPAKSSAKCAAFIPGWDDAGTDISSITDTEPLHDKTVAYWHEVTAQETQFEQPNEILADIIKASQVHCLLAARSEDDSRVAAWIGAVNYGPLESEAHSVIRGMLFTGNAEYTRRSLDFFIHRYNPEGFLTTGYTVMGTGWHLWALGEYYALTRDKAWMEANASEVARVCKWVMAQREKTKRLDVRGEKVPEWGLATPGVCADWSVYAYYFYINGNYYAGLKSAGEALLDIGHPDANAILANAEELRECTMRAYKHAQSQAPVFPLKDGTWAPMYPTQAFSIWPTNQMYPASDSGRSWCYDVEIGAHHLVPMGVMDPKSDDTRWMMDHMEDVQFLESGWFYYPKDGNEKDWFNLGGFAKVQPYYARTVEVHEMRDDVKPYIRSYFNSVISLLNREDLSLWEHFINGAYNKTHETGYFLYETRAMFLREDGDSLWIAPFVTNNWLKDGQSVGVKRAVTKFGEVSYRITSHASEGHIDAEIAVPSRQTPSEIVVRLRHPEGKKMKSVTVNGKPTTGFDPVKETIRIPEPTGALKVRAEF